MPMHAVLLSKNSYTASLVITSTFRLTEQCFGLWKTLLQ